MPPAVTEPGFTSYEDQATGGNLDLSAMLPTVTESLQTYWADQVSGSTTIRAPQVVAGDPTSCDGQPTVVSSTTR